MNIDLNSPDTYYIAFEGGNFGEYPREITANGRTAQEVMVAITSYAGQYNRVTGPFTRDEAYLDYKKRLADVRRHEKY